jgi:anti-sigma regulatory factor (Ser/Thr protein kinase)
MSNESMAVVKELTVEAVDDNLTRVIEFVDQQIEKYHCSEVVQMTIEVAVEELFLNIAHYAYDPDTGPATVQVTTEKNPLSVIITFIDEGVPYDPLARDELDVEEAVRNLQVGGFGIFMIKKSMDDVHYEYRDGKNILTIRRNFEDSFEYEGEYDED